MRRTFKDDYQLFEADVEDKDGKTKTWKAKTLTGEAVETIPELCEQYDAAKNWRKKNSILQEIMVLIFGGKKRDYKKYSHRICWEIFKAFSDDMKSRGEKKTDQPQEKSETA